VPIGRTHSHVKVLGEIEVITVSCCDHDCQPAETGGRYRRILWVALGLNAAMFLIEIVASVIAGSVSLRADALDFLGDAANYAVALAVVGLALHWRALAALLKGSVMGMFGLWVAGSTIYSAVTAAVPKAEVMGAIGLLALAVNLGVAGLLYRYRGADSQALSVWLCTRNDCIANIAVMLARKDRQADKVKLAEWNHDQRKTAQAVIPEQQGAGVEAIAQPAG